jgi:hypothetical protein
MTADVLSWHLAGGISSPTEAFADRETKPENPKTKGLHNHMVLKAQAQMMGIVWFVNAEMSSSTTSTSSTRSWQHEALLQEISALQRDNRYLRLVSTCSHSVASNVLVQLDLLRVAIESLLQDQSTALSPADPYGLLHSALIVDRRDRAEDSLQDEPIQIETAER